MGEPVTVTVMVGGLPPDTVTTPTLATAPLLLPRDQVHVVAELRSELEGCRQRLAAVEFFLESEYPDSWPAIRGAVGEQWTAARRLRPSGIRGVAGTRRPLPDESGATYAREPWESRELPSATAASRRRNRRPAG